VQNAIVSAINIQNSISALKDVNGIYKGICHIYSKNIKFDTKYNLEKRNY